MSNPVTPAGNGDTPSGFGPTTPLGAGPSSVGPGSVGPGPSPGSAGGPMSNNPSSVGPAVAGNSQQAGGSNEQPSTVLAYPLPPLQYINSIDPENLPAPPAPITEGVYYMFGQKISMEDAIIAPLEAHGTKRLYPRTEYDHKKELKKINASILVNFLDLVDVLVKCPDTDKRIEKCNDLATLFINFHHLINELRPHQARETLRVWLNAQRKTREEITKKLNQEMDRMTRVLDKYMEYEAAKKQSRQQQAEANNTGDKLSTSAPAPTTGVSLDDMMCKLVDESCT